MLKNLGKFHFGSLKIERVMLFKSWTDLQKHPVFKGIEKLDIFTVYNQEVQMGGTTVEK